MLRRVFCLFTVMLLPLAACQNTALPAPEGALSFTSAPPFKLNVSSVDVIEEYQSPGKAPQVEHLFKTTPAEGVRIWVRDRIRPAAASENRLEVIIKDARVTESALPKTQGIKGAFTKDQSQQFDGRVEVELRIYRGNALVSEASINAQSTRSRTLREDASIASREALFDTLNREMLQALNAELDKNIRSYFTAFLMY